MDIPAPGLIAGAIARAVVQRLVGNGLDWRPAMTRRRATRMAFAFVLSVLAVVQISTVYFSVTTNRNLALHLDNAEARLTHMVQIIQNIERHNSQMMGNSASSTLSQNPGKISEGEDDHPQRDETMFPDRSQDSQDDATTMKQHRPWRLFNVLDDHVLVVHCEGEKLRLLIYNQDQDNNGQARHNCGGGHPHEEAWWTPSMHDGDSYRALFWSRPGEERVAPFAWPWHEMWERLTAAMLLKTWFQNPLRVDEKTPPKSFTIAYDEVLFYRPSEGRTTKMLIAAREDVVHLRLHELAGPVVSPLPPQSVLALSFTDSQWVGCQEVHRIIQYMHLNFYTDYTPSIPD